MDSTIESRRAVRRPEPRRTAILRTWLAYRNGEKEIWHPGGQQRVSTALYIVPSKQFAIAILSNLENVPVTALAREISDILLQ